MTRYIRQIVGGYEYADQFIDTTTGKPVPVAVTLAALEAKDGIYATTATTLPALPVDENARRSRLTEALGAIIHDAMDVQRRVAELQVQRDELRRQLEMTTKSLETIVFSPYCVTANMESFTARAKAARQVLEATT